MKCKYYKYYTELVTLWAGCVHHRHWRCFDSSPTLCRRIQSARSI